MKKKGLHKEEQAKLKEFEAVIQEHELAFVQVGRALLAINDEKLYRADYRDFDSYIAGRWDMSKSRAYRLMGAASVINDLSPIGDILPVNEAQARPLTPFEGPERVALWREVLDVADGGRITASLVSGVVERFLDESGQASRQSPAADDVFSRISAVKKMLKKMETKPEYATFCKKTETKLKKLVDEVERHYTAAMNEYLNRNAA